MMGSQIHALISPPSPCSTPVRKRHRAYSDISPFSSHVKTLQGWLQTQMTRRSISLKWKILPGSRQQLAHMPPPPRFYV